ncbi:MAG: polyprenyl synthetase family protein [Bacteroidales bacterium]|nr:polyprenyl synthetase family protein [Bacteroidales bacterium]
MDIKAIKEYLGVDWLAVQNQIVSSLKSDIGLLNATNDSILSHSGKQLRPMLSLLMAKACSGGMVSDAAIKYAAAAELLHNATLLHDDVADGSDKRRGVPTIMSLMGSSVSVLVGDYWLVKAMELVLDAADDSSKVMKVFSKTLSDLAEGEMLQLQKARKGDTDEDDYLRIIYNKTASLFEAACVSAAISSGASEEMVKAAKDYAVALGLAFQIKDDILDYSGTEAVGKPLGADILEQKMTLPLLGAFANAGKEKETEIRVKINDIESHPEEYRNEIVAFVKEYNGLEYAVSRLNSYVEAAVGALSMFPDSEARDSLIELAHFTADRIM